MGMTENKRFTLEEFGLNFVVNDNGKNLTAKQTVELLNELNDENKQLRKENKELHFIIQQDNFAKQEEFE